VALETSVNVAAMGELPLGSTKGKIQIRSPDLATPISVGYEVRCRRELWIIALCAGIGALLGWLVRGWMTPKKALLAARVVASGAAELIQNFLFFYAPSPLLQAQSAHPSGA
jgi:hypothetical protein